MRRGGLGDDTIFGGNKQGGAGADLADLGPGSDRLSGNGGTGADGSGTVNGGNGRDTLAAGGGFELPTGGAGADSFVFAAGVQDGTITGFEARTGRTDLADAVGTGYFGVRSSRTRRRGC